MENVFFFVYLEWYIIRTLCPMSVSTAEPAYVGRLRKLSSPYFTPSSFSRAVQVHALPGMSKNSSSEQIYDTCQNFNATILRRQAYSHVGGQCILSYIYKMIPGHVLSYSARWNVRILCHLSKLSLPISLVAVRDFVLFWKYLRDLQLILILCITIGMIFI